MRRTDMASDITRGDVTETEASQALYDVLADGNAVLEYWNGRVRRDDVVAHERVHLEDGRVKLGASVLVDAREARFGFSPEEVQDIVDELYAGYIGRLRLGKCALLVNEASYRLAQAYERQMKRYGVTVIVFNSLNVACAWLGLEEDRVSKHLDRLKDARSGVPRNAREGGGF